MKIDCWQVKETRGRGIHHCLHPQYLCSNACVGVQLLVSPSNSTCAGFLDPISKLHHSSTLLVSWSSKSVAFLNLAGNNRATFGVPLLDVAETVDEGGSLGDAFHRGRWGKGVGACPHAEGEEREKDAHLDDNDDNDTRGEGHESRGPWVRALMLRSFYPGYNHPHDGIGLVATTFPYPPYFLILRPCLVPDAKYFAIL